ncbi:MAG: hypothetical protein DWQ07_10375 [Chloroflexi bacterium]|nr:MAG: hypothetical protein DWQ07_10375 [Chloroflexota bacterium]MBL1192883.1 hypothetical protein [Chloroflexota bacterium]NOH10175.1 hypothetical protein [Chloroflexota bacterium]
MKHNTLFALFAIVLVACSGATETQSAVPDNTPQEAVQPTVEEGAAPEVVDNGEEESDAGTLLTVTTGIAQSSSSCAAMAQCSGQVARPSLCGELSADDGTVWQLPAPITDGATAVDIHNDCTGPGNNPDFESQLSTQVIDEGGTEITAYLFADNYFEFYANGQFVGRDSIGFTPFNSAAARYQVNYPVTYAVLLVDWEGYLGVGLEDRNGSYHIGDGGFIASFSDGTVTNADWKCQVYYVAPVDDASCVAVDANGNLDSSACPSSDNAVSCVNNDPENTCQAVHAALPADWDSPTFDDSTWLPASTFTADDVTNAEGFRNYENTLFSGADFIWSSNLDLDNQVVCRSTVSAP